MNDMNAEPKNLVSRQRAGLQVRYYTYNGVDEGLDVGLSRRESQPDRSHHDRKSDIHGEPNTIRHNIAIALDERFVEQS